MSVLEKKISNKKLSTLKKGQKGIIVTWNSDMEYKSILLSMGILPGDEIEVVNKSLFGSPIYFKHGESTFFALRKNQADLIEVSSL